MLWWWVTTVMVAALLIVGGVSLAWRTRGRAKQSRLYVADTGGLEHERFQRGTDGRTGT